MYPWQQEILEKMTQYKGRGLVQITGRGIGKGDFSAQAMKRLMDDINNRPIEDLVLGEGKVYGSRYYTVEPIGGNWMDMEIWATETYGKTQGSIWAENTVPNPGERWYMNARKFWFKYKKDRDWFILKWSS